MDRTRGLRALGRAGALLAVLLGVCAVWASQALATAPGGYARITPACAPPGPGEASCFALASVPVPAREAGSPNVRRVPAAPAALSHGPAGGLTPALLESAYGYESDAGGSGETVAIVDAFDDPNIESDLAKFSAHYELPACTSKTGCFRKVNQFGSSAKPSLPPSDKTGWSVEISLDVEMVHSVCPECRILLVEAKNTLLTNLGAAVTKAVEMGAGVVSNSYGGAESETFGPPERALFEHPGAVIAAATGDDGYDSWTTFPDPETTNAPASMPGVISVGGTTLSLNGEGKRARETVWNGNGRENEREYESGASGGGCSIFFEAPFWQRYAPGFAASGCGDKRLNADVAAVADPVTGFDIYDTYDCGPECEELKANGTESWSTIGGTSVSTPLIASLYGLAGGADGITYPAETLYAHLGDASLFDVESNGNGYCNNGGGACGINAQFHEELDCEGTTACNAAPGFDGPSGVGAPVSLEAFEPLPEEESVLRRKAEEAVEAEARARAEQERLRREGEERIHREEGELARKREEEAARKPAEEAAKAKGGQGTAGFKAVKAAVPDATLLGARLQAGRGGWVALKIACPVGVTSCQGKVTVRTLSAVLAGHGGVLTLAGASFKVAGGHVGTVRVRLTPRARSLLASRGSLRVRVTIVAHDASGAAHTSHATATLHAFRGRG